MRMARLLMKPPLWGTINTLLSLQNADMLENNILPKPKKYVEVGSREVEVGTQEVEVGTQEVENGTQEFNLSNFLYLITQNPKISRKEIADYFKISVRTLQRKINSFGNIKYVGSGKNGKWTIKKD